MPVLRDGAVIVWDSLAITERVAEGFAAVWPEDPEARAWARSAAAEMHAGFMALREECSMSCGVRVSLYTPSEALQRDIARVGELWNEGLARFGGPYLAGPRFTAVDAFFAPVAFRALTYGLSWSGAAADYPARLRALPAMREWYEAGLAETWRDRTHESHQDRQGRCTEDLRAPASS